MSLDVDAISLFLPAYTIAAFYDGGWNAFLKDIGTPKARTAFVDPSPFFDGHLVRYGVAQSHMALETQESQLKDWGLRGLVRDGQVMKWKDYCIVESLGEPFPCDWLHRADQSAAVESRVRVPEIWAAMTARLDAWDPEWQKKINALGQIESLEKRRSGEEFTNNDVLEGIVKAVLSNSTDWSRVQRVLPELRNQFFNFDLAKYANATTDDIGRIVAWFQSHKAGSMTLRQDLIRLISTAKKLSTHATAEGTSADHYFSKVLQSANGDVALATRMLGDENIAGGFKLPGLGIPLAAEAMKNIGYDVAKPDRHICRALACFGLLTFKNWKDQSGTKSPTSVSAQELFRTMRVMEYFAWSIDQPVSYVDQVLWLLCAKQGPHASNDELIALR